MADNDRPALRARMRAARRAIPARQRLSAADAVARHLREAFSVFSEPARIAGYWACDGELPLHPLLAGRLPFTYLLPRVRPGRRLDFLPWHPGAAVLANRFGIPEPAEGEAVEAAAIDLILLPLLAFDRSGLRLGSGGGYYDRSLAFVATTPRPARPLLVGVGYALQEVGRLSKEVWDIRLDWMATEAGVFPCAQP